MIGYSGTVVFSVSAIKLWEYATGLIDCLPEEKDLRCHELARAMSRMTGLSVVDGKFGPVDHSWLVFGTREAVLDVYVVGGFPPVQLASWADEVPSLLQSARKYKRGPYRDDVREEVVKDLVLFWSRKGFLPVSDVWRTLDEAKNLPSPTLVSVEDMDFGDDP